MTAALLVVVTLAAAGVGSVRWLRVAQREHYLGGMVTRFANRWAGAGPVNAGLALLVPLALIGMLLWTDWLALVVAVVAAVWPLGLGLRGRTSALAWTRRMRTTAAAGGVVALVVVAVFWLMDAPVLGAALVAGLVPVVVDVALFATAPLERRAAARFVRSATARLDEVDPLRIAITGSYGKTTVKGYVRHLVEGTRSVLASPASFNNTAGLSRTMNEHLAPGTEVLVAEMGTYGPGEIAELCSWVRPDISAICAIGPVHLERMKTLDTVVAAKSEILDGARHVVLNVDAHGLAAVADRMEAAGTEVTRVSGGDQPGADVVVTRTDDGLAVTVGGSPLATVDLDAAPTNVATAVGLAMAAGVPAERIAERLGGLTGAAHRQEVTVAASGVTVIDDTFNSNPAGVAAALDTLAGLDVDRRVVVTPGMVELGPMQDDENRTFGRAAAEVADDVIVVARTNRRPLAEGASAGSATLHYAATREDAVAWVRANLAARSAVLYENDLPDHFP